MSRFSGTDLEQGKQEWLKVLDHRIDQLETAGKELAEKERDYRIALSKKLLNLNEVRSGSVKTEIAKGIEEIAQKRLDRDIAKVHYDTVQQSIYQAKIELGVIREDIMHERVQR